MTQEKRVLLIIRDGYGERTEQQDNAVRLANTPFTDELMKTKPTCLLKTSGEDVGLPKGYMGGSEVGHLTIGSGRIVWQSLERINRTINDESFFENPAFTNLIEYARKNNKTIHLAGLLQDKGVHAHQDHLFAFLQLCKQAGVQDQVKVHVFADGRDSPPRSLPEYTKQLQEHLGEASVATLIGRYYSMDRDTRWQRTKLAYDLLTQARGERHDTLEEATQVAYDAGENDEFIKPRVVGDYQGMCEGDVFICYNYRTDRVRQLCKALLEEEFQEFTREKTPSLQAAVMTSYYGDINAQVAYDTTTPTNILGEVISNAGLHQLRISETEKYPHVTFFFNGQREKAYPNEERILIPSPREVATYDEKPEMSIYEIKDQLLEQMKTKKHSLIVVNYVNGDMVGHTGLLQAAIKAVEAVDNCVQETIQVAQECGYDTLVFADHGNCEEMAGEHQTSHTLNEVDCILVSKQDHQLRDGGLQDIAPTALALLGLPQPKEMTGKSLLE